MTGRQVGQGALPPSPGRGESGAASAAWSGAVAAVTLLAVDPDGLCGLRLRASAGPERDRLLEILRALLPPGAPFRKLPVGIADARLLGGLDLAATLSSGRPVLQRGLLAEVDGGVLLIPGAERATASLAGRLAMAIDAGAVTVERDGFATTSAACFAIVACDEALPDEDAPPAVLTERLGLVAGLAGVRSGDLARPAPDAAEIAAARRRLRDVTVGDAATEALAEVAVRLGVFGLRPLMFARTAARASAALEGRREPDEADLALAARLVLGPRATQIPDLGQRPQEETPPPPSDEGEDAPPPDADDGDEQAPGELSERVLEATAASLPSDVLTAQAAAQAGRMASRAAGKSGASLASKRRGRPIGARPGMPENGARLDVLETLRAAAPWQRLRRREKNGTSSPSPLAGEGWGEGSLQDEARSADVPSRGSDPSSDRRLTPPATFSRKGRREDNRILVRREDFRIQRLKEKRRTLTIFVVDASGSAAMHRLAEAKGAVELLLAQAYVRRDEVALIAFRAAAAELVLPPTRSLARAKRALGGLPGGGGTPLATGIDAAALLADSARRRGDTPTLVFLTDGQANVARDGAGGRAKAQEDATAAARALKGLALASLVIDCSPRPQVRARELAETMGARYLPLPSADSGALSRAVDAAR